MPDKIVTLQNLKTFKDHLADVAVSGSYDDLKDTPDAASELEILRLFRTEYSITTSVANGYVVQGSATTVWTEETAKVTVAANVDYNLPTNITVAGALYNYDKATGEIVLFGTTGPVSITVNCESDQPGGLTPFAIGDQVLTGDYIVFDGTISDATMLAFCQGLTYEPMGEGAEYCRFVSDAVDGSSLIRAYKINDWYAFTVGGGTDAMYGWVSAANPDMGIMQAGWILPEDGKAEMISNFGTIGYINTDVAGWNGIIVGLEKGEQPSGLTPFFVGQTLAGYDFGDAVNGETSAELDTFLANQTYQDSQCLLLQSANQMLLAAGVVPAEYTDTGVEGYALIAVNGSGDQDIVYVYSTQPVKAMGMTVGWQNLTNGKVSCSHSPEVATINTSTSGEWNGVLIGAVEGEQPQPTGLTPFEVGDNVVSVQFTNSMEDDDIIAMIRSALKEHGDHYGVLVASVGGDSAPIVSVENNDDPVCSLVCLESEILFCSHDVEMDGHYYIKGWQADWSNEYAAWSQEDLRLDILVPGPVVDSADVGFNGVVFGKSGGAAGLTAIQAGDTFGSIVLDPEGLSDNDMQDWLNALPRNYDDDPKYGRVDIELVTNSNEDALFTIQGSDEENIFMIEIRQIEDNILWINKAAEIDGIAFNEAGWYIIAEVGGQYTATKITQETTLTLDAVFAAATIDSHFSTLNGTVLGRGPIEPVPTVELTEFKVGQSVVGLQFDTSKEEELDLFIRNATYDPSNNTCDLVNRNGGILLGASRFWYDDGKDPRYIYVLMAGFDGGSESGFIVYGSETVTYQGFDIYKGFQNLSDGVLMTDGGPSTVYSVLEDATPSAWNGVLVGAVVK